MKNYPTHDFTERPLSSEKEIKLDMNKPEDLDLICKFGKAISNKYCLLIFKEISRKPMNMIEISRKTNIPISSVSKHIDTLQAAQMIFVNHQPGLKGHAKICYKQITGAQVLFLDEKVKEQNKVLTYELNVGMFSDCKIKAPCGMAGKEKIITLDNIGTFFSPERTDAELLWFSEGFVTYKFPNEIKKHQQLNELSLSLEMCSETIYYRDKYPSDITIMINDVEIVTWTSPGDFGGRRGTFSPHYWSLNSSQFGILKKFKVTSRGVFVDDILINPTITLSNLNLKSRSDIKLTIKIKEDAIHKGGINIFGKNFGDHNQAIILNIK